MTRNYTIIKEMGDLLTEYYLNKDLNDKTINYLNLGHVASGIVNDIPAFTINNYEMYLDKYAPVIYDYYQGTLGNDKTFTNADHSTQIRFYDYTSDAVNLMDYYIKHLTALSKYPTQHPDEKAAIFEHLYSNSYIIPNNKTLKKIQ